MATVPEYLSFKNSLERALDFAIRRSDMSHKQYEELRKRYVSREVENSSCMAELICNFAREDAIAQITLGVLSQWAREADEAETGVVKEETAEAGTADAKEV